jgi:hypothetical protein
MRAGGLDVDDRERRLEQVHRIWINVQLIYLRNASCEWLPPESADHPMRD